MTPEQVAELNHGVYRVFYPHEPGERNNHTLAAVGSDYFGNRWIAAINWIGMPETRTRTDRTTYGTVPVAQTGDDAWAGIERMELIESWADCWGASQ